MNEHSNAGFNSGFAFGMVALLLMIGFVFFYHEGRIDDIEVRIVIENSEGVASDDRQDENVIRLQADVLKLQRTIASLKSEQRSTSRLAAVSDADALQQRLKRIELEQQQAYNYDEYLENVLGDLIATRCGFRLYDDGSVSVERSDDRRLDCFERLASGLPQAPFDASTRPAR